MWFGGFFVLQCTGLVSLNMPAPTTIDEEEAWLMLGRNLQHQHYASRNVAPPLQVAWEKGVKSVVVDHPLAVGDYIFAPTRNGQLSIIDYTTGMRVGAGKLAPALAHVPTIHDNVLIAGTNLGEKTLIFFDLRQALKVLQARYPHVTTSPVVWNNRIFFGTEKGLFFCANEGTGKEVWRYETGAPIHSSPALLAPAVVFGNDKGWVHALDATSGVLLWKRQLEGNIFSHPVLDDSSVYIGTTARKFYALRLRDGQTRWSRTVSGAIFGSPSLYKNTLYLGTNGHEVIAFNRENGEVIWKFQTKGIVNTVPLASPDYVYVTCWDRNLYVLNRYSGKLVFQQPLKRPPKSSPIIYRDFILVHVSNDELVAFANEKIVQARREEK